MKEREIFLDRLRVAAACAVVLLHTITGIMDATDMESYPFENKVFFVALDLVCWCVPVFLLISGYLFLNPVRKISMKEMMTKYVRRIVLALFLFGVPYACLEQIALEKNFRWSMVGKAFLMVLRGESWSHMWYLYLLSFLYLLTPALKWLLSHVPRMAVYAFLSILFILCSVWPYAAKLFELEALAAITEQGIYFFYYICGYLFATWDVERNRRGTKTGSCSGRMLGCAALLAAGMAVSRLSGAYTIQMAYNYPFTTVLSLLIFGWGFTAPRGQSKWNLFWEQAASLSFAVYLVHPVFLNLAYKLFHVSPLSFAIGVSLPLFLMCTLFLSMLSAWALRKIPFLRRYVL